MTDKDQDCHVHETGICGFHNVEVERRKNAQKKIDEMDSLKKVIYGLVLSSTLFLFIVGGSFIFGNETRKESIDRDIAISTKVETISSQLTRLATIIEMREYNNQQLLNSLTDLNENLSTILKTKKEEVR